MDEKEEKKYTLEKSLGGWGCKFFGKVFAIIGFGNIMIGAFGESEETTIAGAAIMLGGGLLYGIGEMKGYHKAKIDYMNDMYNSKKNKD